MLFQYASCIFVYVVCYTSCFASTFSFNNVLWSLSYTQSFVTFIHVFYFFFWFILLISDNIQHLSFSVWLISRSIISSRSSCRFKWQIFILMVFHCIYVYHILIHSFTDGHLGWLRILVILSNAAACAFLSQSFSLSSLNICPGVLLSPCWFFNILSLICTVLITVCLVKGPPWVDLAWCFLGSWI